MIFRLAILFISASLCFALGSFAAAEEIDPMRELRKRENCSQAKEVFYRSKTLKSPISESSVYFDIVLRRPFGNQIIQGDGQEICFGSVETPISNLMEVGEATKSVFTSDSTDYYYVFSPKSFSADGRYLINEYYADYSGESGLGISILTVDSMSEYSDLEINYCSLSRDYQYTASHVTFKGFLSGFQFVVECQDAYADSENESDLWYEAIDLKTKDVRKIPDRNLTLLQNLKSYGVVVSKDEILKIQTFPSP